MLLDDLLVAEDGLSAPGTTGAVQSPQDDAQNSPSSVPERPDSGLKQEEEPSPGSVVMGTPVATPVNGDTSMDISPEHAYTRGPRYILQFISPSFCSSHLRISNFIPFIAG